MSRQKIGGGAPRAQDEPYDPPVPAGKESTRVDAQPLAEEYNAAARAGRRTIKVCWGEENYHPVAYNGFKVGGLELVVDVAPSQTVEEAYDLAWERLEAMVEKQFEKKLEGFINRLRKTGQAVKTSAASAKS